MISRREFLKATGALAAGALAAPDLGRVFAAEARQLRIAAVVTEYRPWSHADVLIGKFIQGLKLDITPHWTPIPLRAMYVDQFPETDLSRALSRQYGFRIVNSIAEAILDERGQLAVD
ncbi:MAG: twin-arginine translocation signal domain-containing protein, partial [Verrucomicrobiota bacterium]